MAEQFDPYYRWLGIPPAEQPPHHYALLGVAKFESDPEVIRNAAFQRLTFLKVLMSGKYAALAEKINAEVLAAKQTLLDDERREAYAELLRKRELVIQPPSTSIPETVSAHVAPTVAPESIDVVRPTASYRRRRSASPAMQLLGVFGGGAIGIAVGLAALNYGFGVDPLSIFPVRPEVAQSDATAPQEASSDSPSPQDNAPPATQPVERPPARPTSVAPQPAAEGANVQVAHMREVANGTDSRLPKELSDGTRFEWLQPAHADETNATLNVKVIDEGWLYLAAHWRNEGSAGSWKEHALSRDQLIASGWEDRGDSSLEEPGGAPYALFRKRVAAGEELQIRTNKYWPPKLFVPKRRSASTVTAPTPANLAPMTVPPDDAIPAITDELTERYQLPAARLAGGDALRAKFSTLLADARRTSAPPSERYVLFGLAMDSAFSAGDVDSAFAIAEERAKAFSLDPADARYQAIVGCADILSPVMARKLFDECDAAIARSRTQAKIVEFERLAEMLITTVKAVQPERELAAQAIRDRATAMRAHFDRNKEFFDRFAAAPDDPVASREVGLFTCLANHDWRAGLPMLLRSGDEDLKLLATKESLESKQPEEAFALGDLWWEFSNRRKEWRDEARNRAAYWYGCQFSAFNADQQRRAFGQLRTLPENFRYSTCNMNGPDAPLLPGAKGFGFLSYVQGAFEGDRELVELLRDRSDTLLLHGQTAQQLGAGGWAYTTERRRLFKKEYREVTWSPGEPLQPIMATRDGICMLSAVRGNFSAGDHEIFVTPDDDGTWYFASRTKQGIDARAVIMEFVRVPEVRVEIAEHRWTVGYPRVRMIHHRDGFCYLSGFGGPFQGFGEGIAVEIDPFDGYWYLRGTSAQGGLTGRAVSVRFFDGASR